MTERAKAIELLPCPFCGGDDLHTDSRGSACKECGAMGPVDGDWNERALALPDKDAEPVAWMIEMEDGHGGRRKVALIGRYKDVQDCCDFGDPIPLYAHPPSVPSGQQTDTGDAAGGQE